MAGELISTSLIHLMNTQSYSYIAVDVAKATLQMQTRERACTLAYDRRGIAALLAEARKAPHTVVVLEATGGYERKLLEALHQAGVGCALVSPDRVRAFARSDGVKAKTDPLDAHVLLRFAEQKALRPMPPPTPQQQELAALLDRRSQLTGMLTEEKNRLQNAPACVHADIRGLIRTVAAKIRHLEQRIQALLAANPALRAASERIESVKGVGPVTAWTILGYLPEITRLSRNQLCALVGIAPYNRDSGLKSRKRCIHGGRAKVRHVLYMAAVSAAHHNPVIRAYVQRLIDRGKAFKCAIVAAMRKLLLHIQALLKKHAFAT